MRDLMAHDPGFSLNDIHLLKIGRHFRLSPKLKLIVGRNEEDNRKLEAFVHEEDVLFKAAHHPGPLSLLRGESLPEEIERAAAITARYGKSKDLEHAEVCYWRRVEELHRSLTVSPMPRGRLRELMIGECN
jgi:predicted ribosome quality control (RQC) complex YloA/Tae2 family protein